MNVLYLLVGRGGSKSIPRKNLAEIAGLSLVGYKARAARKIAAIFCSGGAGAQRRIGEGFNFVVPGGDLGHMLRSAQTAIATARAAVSKTPDAR